jgi:hypothetical protein
MEPLQWPVEDARGVHSPPFQTLKVDLGNSMQIPGSIRLRQTQLQDSEGKLSLAQGRREGFHSK